jgi:hypothetical protein
MLNEPLEYYLLHIYLIELNVSLCISYFMMLMKAAKYYYSDNRI